MKEIPLYDKRGNIVATSVVDDDDYAIAASIRWHVSKTGYKGKPYPYARSNAGGRTTLLHRLISGALPGEFVDHIDHDTLNNQRGNLRRGDRSSNMLNRNVHRNNKLGVRGVSRNVNVNKNIYTAEVVINHKARRAYFQTIDEAVAWRDVILAETKSP